MKEFDPTARVTKSDLWGIPGTSKVPNPEKELKKVIDKGIEKGTKEFQHEVIDDITKKGVSTAKRLLQDAAKEIGDGLDGRLLRRCRGWGQTNHPRPHRPGPSQGHQGSRPAASVVGLDQRRRERKGRRAPACCQQPPHQQEGRHPAHPRADRRRRSDTCSAVCRSSASCFA